MVNGERMSEKEVYRELCNEEKSIPIFMQDWWLDGVVGDANWGVALAKGRSGEVIGGLVFCTKKAWGIKMIYQPLLSQFSGIWMRESHSEKLHRQYARTKSILGSLIDQLPVVHYISQKYHFSLKDGQPFYWAGFTTEIYYTFVLRNISDTALVYSQFNEHARRKIKKAETHTIVTLEDDLALFYQLNTRTYERQGVKNPVSIAIWERIDRLLSLRKQRHIYFAKDQTTGEVFASAYIIWDETTAYYLANGRADDIRGTEALYLLVWKAIQDCSKFVQSFDFEGTMIQRVEPVYRSFGAEQVPYIKVFKAKNKFWSVIREIIR